MHVNRVGYSISLDQQKLNGKKLSSEDLINIGYLGGRCGINLGGNLNENPKPNFSDSKVLLSVNSCTKDVFENTLQNKGIRFEVIA